MFAGQTLRTNDVDGRISGAGEQIEHLCHFGVMGATGIGKIFLPRQSSVVKEIFLSGLRQQRQYVAAISAQVKKAVCVRRFEG
jgi:hypothetical protein